ncbi:hypothetical protein DFJ77DRAFT_161638 [Powellomyces hirtus]|nr:hypothetical protein DFJ77DRAFT_161638 [Powellomyces hirtus]
MDSGPGFRPNISGGHTSLRGDGIGCDTMDCDAGSVPTRERHVPTVRLHSTFDRKTLSHGLYACRKGMMHRQQGPGSSLTSHRRRRSEDSSSSDSQQRYDTHSVNNANHVRKSKKTIVNMVDNEGSRPGRCDDEGMEDEGRVATLLLSEDVSGIVNGMDRLSFSAGQEGSSDLAQAAVVEVDGTSHPVQVPPWLRDLLLEYEQRFRLDNSVPARPDARRESQQAEGSEQEQQQSGLKVVEIGGSPGMLPDWINDAIEANIAIQVAAATESHDPDEGDESFSSSSDDSSIDSGDADAASESEEVIVLSDCSTLAGRAAAARDVAPIMSTLSSSSSSVSTIPDHAEEQEEASGDSLASNASSTPPRVLRRRRHDSSNTNPRSLSPPNTPQYHHPANLSTDDDGDEDDEGNEGDDEGDGTAATTASATAIASAAAAFLPPLLPPDMYTPDRAPLLSTSLGVDEMGLPVYVHEEAADLMDVQ